MDMGYMHFDCNTHGRPIIMTPPPPTHTHTQNKQRTDKKTIGYNNYL